MAGAKGYSSYRGRGGKGKIFLAVLLILVIAAACLVIFFQQHVVYDGNGRPQIVLPWQNGEPESTAPLPEENPQLDIFLICPAPTFEVIIIMVFLKFITLPLLSVSLPSSSICKSTLNTSGCAFSTSSNSTTE